MEYKLLVIILSLLGLILFLIIYLRAKPEGSIPQLQFKVDELQGNLLKLETNLKQDFKLNREETATLAKDNRIELNNTLKDFKSELSGAIKDITDQNQLALRDINKTLADKIDLLITKMDGNNKENRESLASNLKDFILDQRSKMEELKLEQKETTLKTIDQLEKITNKVEEKLSALTDQSRNDHRLMREELGVSFKGFQETIEAKQNELVRNTENKLETIRVTVEEKLEKTLSERLNQSFETVGRQLIEVQKGLGEMQTMASDVGGLKKVLSNVKLRGGIGEVQLAMLLEQILAPNQYESNVRTKPGSTDSVEFAIKLPGRNEDEKIFVYLPIDAKFPKDIYEHLILAYDRAIPEEIEIATRSLETTIRKMARDIRDKYIDPPQTTDFAIMFLPFESIYAEVIRRSALVDQLRDEFKITVAGPTTLFAILNSLQMGFRTLALHKRSSEVWRVLASVKNEFEKFGGMLEKAQKNIQTGLSQLENVAGPRSRSINRQLNNIESLPPPGEQEIPEELIELDPTEDEMPEQSQLKINFDS
ncbi:MAG: DNA recombination protein RmuC [Saprospiraceae bacterium]|nr:DNA recombination protein RmuC [Saprospiraceae bacterium]